MIATSSDWQPTEIRQFVKNLDTGAGTVLVKTDAGAGYLKAMGNHSGEHVLACEWVGTQLARWFGLSTFDFRLIEVTDADEIPLYRGGTAKTGPAFITRKEKGETWGGKKRQLKRLVNPDDITRLVIFDTWTRNCDRHCPAGKRINRDNVFLSGEAPDGQLLLKAMDHTHCFTCGRDLSPRLDQIGCVQDDGVYGLFPEFRPFLDRDAAHQALARLREVKSEHVEPMTETIPSQWDVNHKTRMALVSFVVARAKWLTDDGNMERKLWPQTEFDFSEKSKE